MVEGVVADHFCTLNRNCILLSDRPKVEKGRHYSLLNRKVEIVLFARERGVGRRHLALISWQWDGNSYWKSFWIF